MFLRTSTTNRRQFLERSVLGVGSVLFLPGLLASCTDHIIPDPGQPPTSLPPLTSQGIDWNDDAKIVVTTGLKMIPEVGEILSGLVEIFWPSTKEDVWGEVKAQVETVVNQKIADNVYQQVSEDLQGLNSSLTLYLNYLKEGTTDEIRTQWMITKNSFVLALPHFQSKGNELPLLGLFAQFANMYLALLRDGVLKGKDWGRTEADQQQDITDLKKAISDFTAYANNTFNTGRTNVVNNAPKADKVKNHNLEPFRTVNAYEHPMTLTVLDYMNTWYSYDITQYPNGNEVVLTREIYSDPYGTCDDSGPIVIATPVPTQLPTQLTVWGWDRIDAVQLTYPANSGPGGVTQTKRMGDQPSGTSGGVNKPPFGGVFTISPDNPITAFEVSYGGIVNTLRFFFYQGNATDTLGGNAGRGGSTVYLSYPNNCMSSIHINGVSNYYGSADCVVFGFKYWQSPSATLRALGSIYIKSPKERSAGDFAKAFPNLAIPANLITEEHKKARQTYWASVKARAEALK